MSGEAAHAPPAPAGGVRRAASLTVTAVPGMPEVSPGDDLAVVVLEALRAVGQRLHPWDVVVVTHKVVSKAEGALVDLAGVRPSARALELAARVDADPRVVEVILGQSTRVLRRLPGILVCETVHGHVCANAGVDRSNAGGGDVVTLLPADADSSARRLRAAWLAEVGDGPLGVIVCDTFGRPFREAGVNVAIGVAGLPAVTDHRGAADPYGYVLRASALATADEIASAAELVMGKVAGVPVAIVRGLRWEGEGRGSAELLRDPARDAFRTVG